MSFTFVISQLIKNEFKLYRKYLETDLVFPLQRYVFHTVIKSYPIYFIPLLKLLYCEI